MLKRVIKFFALASFIFVITTPSIALAQWDPFVQYTTPQRNNYLGATGPLLNSEMQSDLLAYQKSPSWHLRWKQSEQGASISMGSMNWFTLFSDTQVKYNYPIHQTLSFQAQYLEKSDLESAYSALLLEFEKRFGTVGFVFNGVPRPDKADSDIGIAAVYYAEEWRLRLFQNFFDAPRNKHSHDDDTFSRTYPFVYGARLSSTDELWSLGVRSLPKLDWRFPQYQYEITSEELLAQLEVIIPFDEDVLHLQTQTDLFRKDLQSKSHNVANQKLSRSRSLMRLRYEHLLTAENTVLGGMELVARNWNEDDTFVAIPHGYWQTELSQHLQGRVGGDASFYRENKDWQFESRLNLAAEYVFSQNTQILFQGTFDLDEKGTRKRFQGGNVQFILSY